MANDMIILGLLGLATVIVLAWAAIVGYKEYKKTRIMNNNKEDFMRYHDGYVNVVDGHCEKVHDSPVDYYLNHWPYPYYKSDSYYMPMDIPGKDVGFNNQARPKILY